MKAKSTWVINLLKWSLNVIWYLNFLFIAVAFYFLFNEYVRGDTYYFNEKISINMHAALNDAEQISGSEIISNAKLFKDGGRLMMNVDNSVSNTIAKFIIYLLFETIILGTLFYLRKIFGSFQSGVTFSAEIVRYFKIVAICIAFYSPLDWAVHLYTDWILTQNVIEYGYGFYLAWFPDFIGLLVGAVIFAMAKIFKFAFELEQENKEFI